MKAQATKATRPQVLLHINRQRILGQNMLPSADKPSAIELIATAAMVIAVLFANARGWL